MQTFSPGTVLVVDDELAHQHILAHLLRRNGYTVWVACSGAEALRLAHRAAPDLILLDLGLPDLDGHTVCGQLKADLNLRAVPVIFLSGDHDTRSKLAAFELGAVDYVTKPFQGPEVLARVRTNIELHRLQSSLEREVTARTVELEAQVRQNNHLLGAVRSERALLAERVAERTVELQLLNERLAHGMQIKDEFLAGMSHELRAPLNIILGLAELFGEGVYGSLDARQQQAIATIAESGEHLLNLINDMLDLAKIEAGREELSVSLVSPFKVSQAAVRMVQQLAGAGHVAVVEALDGPNLLIEVDECRLRQILVNLLANAIKFTPEGGQVGLTLSAEAGGELVRFTVWDTGVGIPANRFGQLFRAFAQIEGGPNRRAGGSGLGLALVARLVRMHGGSVGLTSFAGAGSRFSVALPRVAPCPNLLADGPAPRPDAPLVLIVDDYAPAAYALATLLREAGYRAAVAVGADEATELGRAAPPLATIVTLPIAQSEGLELLHRLRYQDGLVASVLLALGSVVLPDSASLALAAGADLFFPQPLPTAELLAQLEKVATATPVLERG